MPKVAKSDTKVLIGPSLLASDQLIIIALLTDGRPVFPPPSNPLVDVPAIDSKELSRKQARFEKVLKMAALAAAIVAIFLPISVGLRLGLALIIMLPGAFLVVLSTFATSVSKRVIGRSIVSSADR